MWAPILLLLLRVLQGFALGGESAGANVLSTEVGPDGKRGFFVSLVTSGIFFAWIIAVGAVNAVSMMSPDDVVAWGWRLPFLASIILVAIGIWMRMKIEESAVFVKAIERKTSVQVPFIELLTVAKKPFFIVLVAAMAESASGFFFLVFGYSYAVGTLKIPASTLLQAMLIGSICALFLTPMYGALSDRIGRRIALSCAYLIAGTYTAFFFFPLLESGNTTLIMLAMIIPLVTSNPISLGVIGSFYSEQFSRRAAALQRRWRRPRARHDAGRGPDAGDCGQPDGLGRPGRPDRLVLHDLHWRDHCDPDRARNQGREAGLIQLCFVPIRRQRRPLPIISSTNRRGKKSPGGAVGAAGAQGVLIPLAFACPTGL